MSASTNMSIYIPRMKSEVTEQFVMDVFHNNGIGKVNRVDFKVIENDQRYKKAFLHFDQFYNTEMSLAVTSNLMIESEEPFKLYVNPKEYWMLVINRYPIQEAVMNIHQIEECVNLMSKRVKKQDEEMDSMRLELESMRILNKQMEAFIKSKYELSELPSYNEIKQVEEKEDDGVPLDEKVVKLKTLMEEVCDINIQVFLFMEKNCDFVIDYNEVPENFGVKVDE
jgi:hypothetical protein